MNNAAWIFAGCTSNFIEIEPTNGPPVTTDKTTKHLQSDFSTKDASLGDAQVSVCKIFQAHSDSSSPGKMTEIRSDQATESIGLKEQVLVFKYRGKFHAINNECPHRSYPLSNGSIYDIEDFGIVLSAGIRCPKHGWAFDLFTGESEKGAYRLKLWDVEIRDRSRQETTHDNMEDQTEAVQEVWIRRKRQRMG